MSRTAVIQDLRRTVDRLPLHTRRAMLAGLDEERIIVGAYTDMDGGVCPMLAAHRRGGRTSFLRFAKTWDRFTRAPARGSRSATARELGILRRHLEASIKASAEEIPEVPLASAIAEHRQLVARRPPVAVDRPDTPPVRPAARRRGSVVRLPSWMRPIATIEEYERVLEEVDRQAVRLGTVDATSSAGVTASTTGAGREPAIR